MTFAFVRRMTPYLPLILFGLLQFGDTITTHVLVVRLHIHTIGGWDGQLITGSLFDVGKVFGAWLLVRFVPGRFTTAGLLVLVGAYSCVLASNFYALAVYAR